MASDFVQRVNNDILVAFLPMQTFLVEEYGKPMEQHLSEWVLDHPEEFQSAIRRSFAAGCDMTHTATQASSPFRSQPYGKAMVDRVYELNFKSAKLAREVTPEDHYVVGNISHSNPDFLEPLGNMTYDEVYEGYKLQILGLAEGGVDVFHIAGNHIEEGIIAIKVANDLTDIPVIAHDVFYPTKKGFRSMMGLDPKTSAARLHRTGAEVIGTNCGLMTKSRNASEWYPSATTLVKEMRQGTDRPLCIQPDPGIPQIINSKTVWPVSPEEMASEVPNWVDAGAHIVGGCCGTGLEHYGGISTVIRERRAKGL
jgi:5-methyltetrahydrofolate--homocysteine methyltransferase